MTGNEVTLRTGLKDPVAIALAKSLFDEAAIPYFTVNATPAGHRDVETFIWWTVLVPAECEDEAREILLEIEATA